MKLIWALAAPVFLAYMSPVFSGDLTLSYCLESPDFKCQKLARQECANKNGDACWLAGFLLPLNDKKEKIKYGLLGCNYGSPLSCQWLVGFSDKTYKEKFLYKACNLSTTKTKNGADYCQEYAEFLEDFSDNFGGITWALSKACKLGDSNSCRKIRDIKKDCGATIFLQEKAFLLKKFFNN